MLFTYRKLATVFQLLYSAAYCETPEDRQKIFIHFPFPNDLNPCDYFDKEVNAKDVLNGLPSLDNNYPDQDNIEPKESTEASIDKIIPQDIKNFVSGVIENTKDIDRKIELNLLKWNINRLGICELIILRMAIYLFIKDLAAPEKTIKYIKKLVAQFGLERAKNLLIQTFMSIVNNTTVVDRVNNERVIQ